MFETNKFDKLEGFAKSLIRPRSRFTSVGWFAAGALLGAVGMYILDPEVGARRRARAKDRISKFSEDVSEQAGSQYRHAKENIKEMWSGARENLTPHS